MKNFFRKNTGLKIITLALVVIIIVSSVNLYLSMRNYEKSNELYENTLSEFVETKDSKEDNKPLAFQSTEKKQEAPEKAEEPKPLPWYEMAQVDLPSLQKINPEIIGFLYFENEEIIRYPLLYSGDNDKYLRMTFDGQSATAGSIFLEGSNDPGLYDMHNIIYGHNMRNLSMFGSLKNYYREPDYYKTHRYFQIFTLGSVKRYEVSSFRQISVNDGIYTVYRDPGEDYNTFMKNSILKGGVEDMEYKVKGDEPSVTLSTCSGDDNTRFVVNAVLVEENFY